MIPALFAAVVLLAIIAVFGWTRYLELCEHLDDTLAELETTQRWLSHANERADDAESRAAAAVRETADAHRCLAMVLREPVSEPVSEPV